MSATQQQVLLAVNAGSSSVRLALLAVTAHASGHRVESLCRWHGENTPAAATALQQFLAERPPVQAVVHRVVHGGDALAAPCRISTAVRAEIDRWAPLAPLHNPVALRWMEVCDAVLGAAVPQFATFDTALFVSLPAVAHTYALPHEVCVRHAVRRYGFHGLAHEAMRAAFVTQRPELARGGRLITLQLGSGCSATAFLAGEPMDTTMGYSPLEGLMMSTRCGDVDPGLLLHLLRTEAWSLEQCETMLTRHAGLLGVSGESADMRQLQASSSPAARLAVQMICYRVSKAIGAFAAVLQGVDGIVLGGGIGENMPAIRATIVQQLGWLGVQLDASVNESPNLAARCISRGKSPQVWVVPVDEAQVMVQKVAALSRSNSSKEP